METAISIGTDEGLAYDVAYAVQQPKPAQAAQQMSVPTERDLELLRKPPWERVSKRSERTRRIRSGFVPSKVSRPSRTSSRNLEKDHPDMKGAAK
jgi:hypothetical protein